MPLLNICAVTGNKKTVQIGLCFLSGEKEHNYAWAITAFREFLAKYNISDPITIVTDRELALMNCLDSAFPNSTHILCIWHVNMNILANCRKLFPKDKQVANNIIPDPKWEEFLKDWNNIINSTTEAEYNTHLAEFQKHEGQAVQYVQDTWLDPWKEKLVRFWVDMTKHFGVRFTSPIEGCHAMLKAYLRVSTGDLKGVYDRLLNFWPDQHLKI
jgi:transposase-like protein